MTEIKEKYIFIDSTKGEDDVDFKINNLKGQDIHNIIMFCGKLLDGFNNEILNSIEFKKVSTKLIFTEHDVENEETGELETEVQIEFSPTIKGVEAQFVAKIITVGITEMMNKND